MTQQRRDGVGQPSAANVTNSGCGCSLVERSAVACALARSVDALVDVLDGFKITGTLY
jgi:hypothetical protein